MSDHEVAWSGKRAVEVCPLTKASAKCKGAGPGSVSELIYGPHSAVLSFVNMTFSPFAQTPNELSAAHLVDEVAADPRAAKLISFLDNEPFPKLPGDLEKITPDGDLTAVYEIGFSGANIQKLTLESRLDDLHNGSNGFSSNMKVNRATVKSGGPSHMSTLDRFNLFPAYSQGFLLCWLGLEANLLSTPTNFAL